MRLCLTMTQTTILLSGEMFYETVSDYDSDYDLALVESDMVSVSPAKFGSLKDFSVGDIVVVCSQLRMNKEKVMILTMMIFVGSFLQASRGLAADYGEITLNGPGFFCTFVTVAPNTADAVEIRVYEADEVVYMAEALQPCQHLIKQRGELMMLPTAPSRELRSFFVTKETVQQVKRFACRPGVQVMRVPIRHIYHIHPHMWYGLLIQGVIVFTSFFFLLYRSQC
ncbi:unnamed protein product [Eruca vesicaria subsp. sativa]|uniref:Uncharacterized protein n=1 Tax=Eruca vesicaria subsp. sativa TaxID=29727 RepID=A0ABC8LKM4_ERUVS|nr:unnamed protein product [Eruca vesicaria subsp. sativa]